MVSTTIPEIEHKEFIVGTTGWRASDLDDPRLERLWAEGRYEIIDGVLTAMAPAYFDPSSSLYLLQFQVTTFQNANGIEGRFATECDIIIDNGRLVRADAVWMTNEQRRRQHRAAQLAGRSDPVKTRILIPPSIVIESVSYGHDDHDRITKFGWYAEFGIPNYWIFDGLKRTLDCFALERGKYVQAAKGAGDENVSVPFFDGLVIRLADLWIK